MNERVIIGIFQDRDATERAYTSATSVGYTRGDLGLLMSHESHVRNFGHADPGSTWPTKAASLEGLGSTLAEMSMRDAYEGEYRIFAAGTLAGPVPEPTKRGSGFVKEALIQCGVPETGVDRFQHGITQGAIVFSVTLRDPEHAQRLWREWGGYGEQVYLLGPEGEPTTPIPKLGPEGGSTTWPPR